MKVSKEVILETVWSFYNVPAAARNIDAAAIGWPAIAKLLDVSIRHCQNLFGTDGFFSPWTQESMCNMTYLAIPPNRMAVFYGRAGDEDKYWDQLGAAAPIVCRPQDYAVWRSVDGPFYRHVIDLWRRFPRLAAEEIDGINGGMATTKVTKARLRPVCWDTRELLRMERFRRQTILIQKAAAGAGYTTQEYLRIKSPNSYDAGPLVYVGERFRQPTHLGQTR